MSPSSFLAPSGEREGRGGSTSLRAVGRGFTLLEVMIAMAILGGSLTWLVVGMSRNIDAAIAKDGTVDFR